MFLFTKRSKLLLQNFQSKQVLVTMKSTMLSKGSCPHPYRTPPALPSLHCREIQTYSCILRARPKLVIRNQTKEISTSPTGTRPLSLMKNIRKKNQLIISWRWIKFPNTPRALKFENFSITFNVISLGWMHFFSFVNLISILLKACGKCLHFIWWKFSQTT